MRAVPPALDAGKDRIMPVDVRRQLGIARRDPHVGFREHHLHVAEQRREEGPARRHVREQRLVLERRKTLARARSEEHTSELQSLKRNSYAVFCLKKTNT